MNRRSFLTGALALAAMAAIPVKAKAKEPQTEGVSYKAEERQDIKVIGEGGRVTLFVNGKASGRIKQSSNGWSVILRDGRIVLLDGIDGAPVTHGVI